MRHALTAVLVCLLAVSAEAHTYRLVVDNGVGSCTCIGHNNRGSLFITARHNFREAETAKVVGTSGESHTVRWVGKHPTEDVAVFEVHGWLADHLPLA